jgi:hypothetical protein
MSQTENPHTIIGLINKVAATYETLLSTLLAGGEE